MKKLQVKALAQWYGSNRMLAQKVGEQLQNCGWVGIPFAGGMSEIVHIRARTILANDLHRAVINLAESVKRWRYEGTLLQHQVDLRRKLFHPDTLRAAQGEMIALGELFKRSLPAKADKERDRYAKAYFQVCWMTRAGTAGTDDELKGKLCLRWDAGGGDSRKRYDSAIDGLDHWAVEFQRVTFSVLDWREFIVKCKDADKHGIYVDPPFPGKPGQKYSHKFTWEDQVDLEEVLRTDYQKTRIVVRFYDTEEARDLYKESNGWTWITLEGGRKQTNEKAPEALIVRN
jgi:DNA adenine methylase